MKTIKTKQVKKATIQPIKPFQTLEEEAAFWDTHSVLDEITEGTRKVAQYTKYRKFSKEQIDKFVKEDQLQQSLATGCKTGGLIR
jgi:ribosome-binding ATPase YchF (GTP1/OBG family)